MASPFCHSISQRPPLALPSVLRTSSIPRFRKIPLPYHRSSSLVRLLSTSSRDKLKLSCFRQDDSCPDYVEREILGDKFSEGLLKSDHQESKAKKNDWPSKLQNVANAVFGTEPWTVPWTAKTIAQVMLIWIASFWLVGSWLVPYLAHAAGFSKETLTYRGQALYSLLTDVAEGLAGIGIIYFSLSKFRPLPSDWFRFRIDGKWQLHVGLGCLMFPLVNRLSQVNLNLLPIFPSTPVAVSSVEQSIVARDPVAMALYAIVVSVCAPVWEEIVFRGFLLPSLTRYMPVWCAIVVSSVAFALAHFNLQRMLPLVFLGIVMGAVFARSRNLFASMLLHSLWNAFVFLDLMK